jgi:hypothetical protein
LKFLGNHLFSSLGYLLGVMQVVVGHWFTVVVAGREGPGLFFGLILAGLLVAANGAVMPALRRARRGEGWPRRVAAVYMAVGLATLLLGLVIVLSWVGFLPLAGLLTLLGMSGDTVFTIFRVLSAAVVGALVWMLLWGFTIGRVRLERTHVRVPLEGLHEDLRGLRIVQISDLHIGNVLMGERLSRVVEAVNALEPDVVALTGDIFDFDPRFVEDGALRLGALRARHGVYLVLGNHDVYTGSEVVADAFARRAPALRLLRDERVRLPVPAPLYLVGVEDPGRESTWTSQGIELAALTELGPRRSPRRPDWAFRSCWRATPTEARSRCRRPAATGTSPGSSRASCGACTARTGRRSTSTGGRVSPAPRCASTAPARSRRSSSCRRPSWCGGERSSDSPAS